jgi:hypothetical protein
MKKRRKLILTKHNLFSVPTKQREPADHTFIL